LRLILKYFSIARYTSRGGDIERARYFAERGENFNQPNAQNYARRQNPTAFSVLTLKIFEC